MQRFLVPIVLLAAAIAALVVSNRQAGEDIVIQSAGPVDTSSTPLLSARRLPEQLARPGAVDEIITGLDLVVEQSGALSCLAVDDAEGRQLFGHNVDATLTPASTIKLFTGTAAIVQLGADYTFETVVGSATAPVGGVVEGDLFIVGGGDPLLHTDQYAATFRDDLPYTRVEDLADQIVAAGITQVNGSVVVDDGRYDDNRFPPGWPERYASQGQSGPLGALMIDDAFSTYPEIQTPESERPVPADDPARHAAALFDDLLEERGLTITSAARAGEAPTGLEVLAQVESEPLADLVAAMLTVSDNGTAELLTKEIAWARQGGGQGTTPAGLVGIRAVLEELGVDLIGLSQADGSGLHPDNAVSCATVVELLEAAPEEVLDGMAVAGRTGTLRDRFRTSQAAGRMLAKSGRLVEVTAISGVIETIPGESLTFSYIVNVSPEVTDELIDVQETLADEMVTYPEGPSVDELAPLTAGSEPAQPEGGSGSADESGGSDGSDPSGETDDDIDGSDTGGDPASNGDDDAAG